MPELTAQELNVAVALALGITCERTEGDRQFFYLSHPNAGRGGFCSSEEMAWKGLPDFSTSLDACKPLIEEINKAGHAVDYRISEESACVQLYTGLDKPLVNGYAEIKESADIIACTATALCRAYLKFKELTKEETR